jgi:hypothetical protein
MTRADRVLSTPPTNTPISQTHSDGPSRRRFLTQAAGVAAGGAALAMALPLPVSAGPSERVPDPILAAIETHKAAQEVARDAVQLQSVFEDGLYANNRLQDHLRLEDERRQGEKIDAAIKQAHDAEVAAACTLLNIDPTTLAGVVTLLAYARDHDDENYGMGWPTDLVAERDETRSWHYFLIANLAEVLPELVRGATS